MLDRRSTKQRRLINEARKLFKERIHPELTIFENAIPRLIAFSRLGTEEEDRGDRGTVEENFKPFYEEFLKWLAGREKSSGLEARTALKR